MRVLPLRLGQRLLGAFVLVVGLSLAAATVFSIDFFGNKIRDEALDNLRRSIAEARHMYASRVDDMDDAARFLANTPSIRNFVYFKTTSQLERWLQQWIKAAEFHQVSVYGNRMQLLAQASKAGTPVIRRAGEPPAEDFVGPPQEPPDFRLLRLMREQGEAVAGGYRIPAAGGPLIAISAAAPVMTQTLHPDIVGAVVVHYVLDGDRALADAIGRLSAGQAGFYFNGRALSRENTPAADPVLLARALSSASPVEEVVFADGGQLAQFVALRGIFDQPLLVMGVAIPAARYVQVLAEGRTTLLLIMLVCMFTAIGLTVWLARDILKPVGRLMEGVHAVSGGDFSRRIQLDREDEFGLLANAFNDMSGRISEFVGILQHTVHTLTWVGTSLSAEKDLDRLLQTVVTEARRALAAEEGVLYLKEGDRLVFRIREGGAPDAPGSLGLPREIPLAAADSNLCAQVARNKQLLTLSGDQPMPPGIKAAGEPGALLLAPLLDREERIVGVLRLRRAETQGAQAMFSADQVEIVRFLASQAAVAIENARYYEKIQRQNQAFARFVPSEFLHHIGRREVEDVRLGDATEARMAVLFADIRGFTSISETLEPQAMFSFLNDYLHAIGPEISRQGGFIDKFIGDGIMALFSDGEVSAADAALAAGVNLVRALEAHNDTLEARWGERLRVGIGIHTGPLALGIIGFEGRVEGTVIGDTVNLASRVENLTKMYDVHLAITGETAAALKDTEKAHLRPLDRVRVRGRKDPTTLYEVFDPESAVKREALPRYLEALAHFEAGRWAESVTAFEHLLNTDPDDPVYRFHVERSRRYLRKPPAEWNGILELSGR